MNMPHHIQELQGLAKDAPKGLKMVSQKVLERAVTQQLKFENDLPGICEVVYVGFPQ